MANYLVSYDLNGSVPTHQQMDKHMENAGWTRGRILETVWYVGTAQALKTVYDHVNSILSKNDQLIVVKAEDASWYNLLISSESLKESWEDNR